MSTIHTTRGALWKVSLQLAWPAVLQAILVNCYAFNDFYFVGRTGDAAATSALSSCFALVIVCNTLVSIFPTGSMTLMAQAFGAERLDRLGHIFRQGLLSTLSWAAVLSVVGVLAMPWIVGSMNATNLVGVRIDQYMSVIFGGLVLFALMRLTTATFYACGNTRLPLILEIVSLLVNTLLNALLVPTYGIEGAAWATLASRGLPGTVGLLLLARRWLDVALVSKDRADWRVDRLVISKIARIGVFESLSGLLYGVVYLMLNRMAGVIGPAAQGGLGAGLRGIEWIAFAFGDGFLKASIATVGQNLGAGKRARAWRAAFLNASMSAISCQVMGLLFLFFPMELSAIVTDDAQTLHYATWYIRIMGWVMWAIGWEMSLYGAMVGAGRTHMTLLVSGALNICRVPLAAFLLFGASGLVSGTLWAAFGVGQPPTMTGDFSALPLTIAITAAVKASLYSVYLYRVSRREK